MSETLMQFSYLSLYNLNMINWYDDIVFRWQWIKNTKLLDGKRKIELKCMSFKILEWKIWYMSIFNFIFDNIACEIKWFNLEIKWWYHVLKWWMINVISSIMTLNDIRMELNW
jgi:hypothetical protein